MKNSENFGRIAVSTAVQVDFTLAAIAAVRRGRVMEVILCVFQAEAYVEKRTNLGTEYLSVNKMATTSKTNTAKMHQRAERKKLPIYFFFV